MKLISVFYEKGQCVSIPYTIYRLLKEAYVPKEEDKK